MDIEEMANAHQRAVTETTNIWKAPDPTKGSARYGSTPVDQSVEVDYGIVKMGDDSYLVIRSHYLGSLDYDIVCNCDSRYEARKIIRALNK